MVDDIIFTSGVKRKSLAAVRTRCKFCKRIFIDKYYDELTHKVVCPYCKLVNATVRFDDIAEVLVMGMKYDIGTGGQYGTHLSVSEIYKKLVKYYGEEKAKKIMKERCFNV